MAQIGLEVGLFMNLLVSRKKLLGNTWDFLWSYGGYLIVSTLCDLCEIQFTDVNLARDFMKGGIEVLKEEINSSTLTEKTYNFSVTDSVVTKFLEYAQSKEGTSILSEGKCDVIDGYYRIPFSVVQNDSTAWLKSSHVVLNDNYDFSLLRLYVYAPDGSLIKSIFDCYKKSFYIATRHYNIYPQYSEFSFLYDDGSISGSIPSIPKTWDVLYLYIPENLVDNVTVLDKTVVYPKNLTNIRSLDDYNNKYTEGKPKTIQVDSDVAHMYQNWKHEETDLYLPTGTLVYPGGVNVLFEIVTYLYKEGDQCTDLTGGWKDYYLGGAQFTDTCILLSQSETHNMFAGTINEIDFSKYNKIYLELESNTDFYLSPATSMSASWFSYLSWKEGTDRKIVSFNLNEEKKISTKIYCAIFKTGTAKIYNIWLE